MPHPPPPYDLTEGLLEAPSSLSLSPDRQLIILTERSNVKADRKKEEKGRKRAKGRERERRERQIGV